MRETTVARTYAEALLEVALQGEATEDYADALGAIAQEVRANRDFRVFLETPRIEPDVKKQVVREVFEGSIPDRLLRFLFVVIDKRRQRLLPEISDEYSDLVDEHFGRLQVRITTALEPDDELRTEIRERLGQALGKQIIPRFTVDPAILGGVIARVGDRVMDGSLRRRLQGLRRVLLQAEMTDVTALSTDSETS